MLVQRNYGKGTYAVEIGKPLYKQAWKTGSGVLEFALVKPYDYCTKYDIVEVSTGSVLIPSVGRLSETSFVNICTTLVFLGAKKIRSQVDKSKKIKDFPLWKEEVVEGEKANEG